MDEHIIVKIVQLGAEVQSFALAPDSNVQELFDQAGRDFVEGEVTRRGTVVKSDTRLCDGDTLVVAKMLKGNADPVEVEIFRLGGGRSITVAINEGQTIKDALDALQPDDRAQFFRPNGEPDYEFRVAGVNDAVSINHQLTRPASGKIRIICSKVVKGN